MLGGLSIIVSGVFALAHLDDAVIFKVLVPGFVVGLILLVVYWLTGER